MMDFTEARDDGVAVASAGPYANNLHLTPVPYHSVFTGQMPFLPSNQQCRSTIFCGLKYLSSEFFVAAYECVLIVYGCSIC